MRGFGIAPHRGIHRPAQVKHLAHSALVDQALQCGAGGILAEFEIEKMQDTSISCRFQHLLRLARIQPERLVAQHVAAIGQGLQYMLPVQERRRVDRDKIDRGSAGLPHRLLVARRDDLRLDAEVGIDPRDHVCAKAGANDAGLHRAAAMRAASSTTARRRSG